MGKEKNKKIGMEDLDELDLIILSELQQDGRKSFTEIAENNSLPISTIRNRYNRLIKNRTLQIIGRVVPNKVGFNVFVGIFIKVQPASLIDSVVSHISKIKEVSYLSVVSGEYDVMVDLMCRDNDHLVDVLENNIINLEGVVSTNTITYLKVIGWRQPEFSLTHK